MIATQNGTAPDRRAFLAATAGAAAVSLLTPHIAMAVTPALTFNDIPGSGDVKVLNYALALEDLETQLYVDAIKRLSGGGTSDVGKPIAGLRVPSDAPDLKYARIFGKVESEHAALVRATVQAAGGPVIPRFKYDFKIETLNRRQVSDLLYTAENTGVSAYLGAVPLFATRTYIPVAAAIVGTEARHTAVIAATLNTLFRSGLNVAPTARQNGARDVPLAPNAVLARVSPFIVA